MLCMCAHEQDIFFKSPSCNSCRLICPWRAHGKKSDTKFHIKYLSVLADAQRFFNEAVNWHKPSFYSNSSDIGCFFLTYRCQSTDGELIGAVECSCADCWSVKVLNQKVSLLLIIHNATNSHVRLSPFFPQPAINILAVVQKEKKKTIYTQLSQWDEQTACRCLFGS